MNIVHLNTAGAGLMSGRRCVCGQRLAPSVVLCRDQPELLKGSNALYAVDACQSLGQLPHNLPAKAFVGQARELGLNLWAGTAAHTPLLLKDLGASHFVRASVGRHITLAQVEQALLTLRSV
ncbi:hypothetical protein ALQ18_01875 [Pseudomonas marginalis pv. marginalis]|nr:hypothetical protein ALQ18_01875 [Pseudomonas marginalis pv. marginalis]